MYRKVASSRPVYYSILNNFGDATRVKSQYKNFDKSWRTYFVPCFILKKGTKYVRQDLSKVFVL